MRELPVDPEFVRQRIYEAGRSLGRNDPFLASELTESVMHFLIQEFDGRAIAPVDLQATVAKIISELGHPQLAIALEDDWHEPVHEVSTGGSPFEIHNRRWPNPRQLVESQLCEYSLQQVYPSSIAAAHNLGLIELRDLELPGQLVGGVVEVIRNPSMTEHELVNTIAQARHRFGRFVELKLSEAALQVHNPNEWCATLAGCLDLANLRGFLHLPRLVPAILERATLFRDVDSTQPIPNARDAQLFPENTLEASPNAVRLSWIKAIVQSGRVRIQPVITIGAADFDDVTMVELLHVLLVNEVPAILVLRRGDQLDWHVTGGVGNHPAEVASVRANLQAFLTAEVRMGSESTLFDRIEGLVRLAFAAGRAKQSFLRRHGHSAMREGFVLDRSPVVVQPMGIAAVARESTTGSAARLDFEHTIVHHLRRAARGCSTHGPPCLLRHERFQFAARSTPVPSYCEEVALPQTASALRSGQELADTLHQLYRETRVVAVWINSSDAPGDDLCPESV